MRKYQPWAILLIIAYLLTALPNPLINMLLARMLSPHEFGTLSIQARMLAGGGTLLRLLLSVVTAIWLFRLARRDGGAPWVWAMFGLMFNVMGLVLYFAMQIYERLRDPTTCASCGYDNRETIRAGGGTCSECGRPLFLTSTRLMQDVGSTRAQ